MRRETEIAEPRGRKRSCSDEKQSSVEIKDRIVKMVVPVIIGCFHGDAEVSQPIIVRGIDTKRSKLSRLKTNFNRYRKTDWIKKPIR
ncbi:hypothetical protein Nepgr_032386 [Nepenthes gracilis]|uniref:Uncharacterized protein n=1 Tax=Nepenthes gracilis TaxID=150966 RepID=A0AAD3TIH9_NEPGR|nr:hypothetical protein Nepgr_032386 [Nepenthes gracilis]